MNENLTSRAAVEGNPERAASNLLFQSVGLRGFVTDYPFTGPLRPARAPAAEQGARLTIENNKA
jgi:hypothetical protein